MVSISANRSAASRASRALSGIAPPEPPNEDDCEAATAAREDAKYDENDEEVGESGTAVVEYPWSLSSASPPLPPAAELASSSSRLGDRTIELVDSSPPPGATRIGGFALPMEGWNSNDQDTGAL
jgi:hypothetical protein